MARAKTFTEKIEETRILEDDLRGRDFERALKKCIGIHGHLTTKQLIKVKELIKYFNRRYKKKFPWRSGIYVEFSEPFRKKGDSRFYYKVTSIKNTPRPESEDMENEIVFSYRNRDYTDSDIKKFFEISERCSELFRKEPTKELLYKNIPLGTIEDCKEIFDIVKSFKEFVRRQKENKDNNGGEMRMR